MAGNESYDHNISTKARLKMGNERRLTIGKLCRDYITGCRTGR